MHSVLCVHDVLIPTLESHCKSSYSVHLFSGSYLVDSLVGVRKGIRPYEHFAPITTWNRRASWLIHIHLKKANKSINVRVSI